MTADNYAELVWWLIHSAECHEDVDGKPSIRAEWLRKTAAAIEALAKERDTRQRDAEYWKRRYDGAITLERKRNAETEAELAECRAELQQACGDRDMHSAVSAGLRAELARVREALQEIAKGEGAFSLDPLTHSSNVIDSMRAIAIAALNVRQNAVINCTVDNAALAGKGEEQKP